MEIIYRICSWLCIGAFLLMFSGIALLLLEATPTPPLLDWVLWLPVYALMLWGGWRKWIGKDKPAEPEKRSRLLSALIWIAVLHILYAVWIHLAFYAVFLKYPFGINADYFLFPGGHNPQFCVYLTPVPEIFAPPSPRSSRELRLVTPKPFLRSSGKPC